MPRTQINFRLDTELLAAIKTKCEAEGVSVTEFLTDAARTALGIETMNYTTATSSKVLESLTARIAEVERRLDSSLAGREEVDRLEEQLEAALGETVA